MSANESPTIVCRNGAFILPERIFRALAPLVSHGFVYLREDDDVLTISTSRLNGGWRRAFNERYRAPMFRDATELAVVDLRESVQVMAVRRKRAAAG